MANFIEKIFSQPALRLRLFLGTYVFALLTTFLLVALLQGLGRTLVFMLFATLIIPILSFPSGLVMFFLPAQSQPGNFFFILVFTYLIYFLVTLSAMVVKEKWLFLFFYFVFIGLLLLNVAGCSTTVSSGLESLR